MKTFQKPLNAGEEAEYIRLLTQGSAEEAKFAKEVLIERNLRSVAHVVKKYQNVDEDPDDLISVGCIGLNVSSLSEIEGEHAAKAIECGYICGVKEMAALIKKNVPEYLLGEWRFANHLANMPVLDGGVRC